jgi:tetratricopeptide (TPR) repeat protein
MDKRVWLLLTIVIGVTTFVGVARHLDARPVSRDSKSDDEQLYVSGHWVKKMSLGFNSLAADWYWMRSLQYVGRKVVDAPQDFQLDQLGQLNLKLLAPLLDTATTLDPQFLEPYEYAAIVLSGIDPEAGIRITKKGIAENPSAWQLYQQLGFIYWQRKDFANAAEAYGRGSEIPGAPAWMKSMTARMSRDGGSRETARQIYQRMFEQAQDEQLKKNAAGHLLKLDALNERDRLREVLANFKGRTGRCPSSWVEVLPLLRNYRLGFNSSGAPLDSTGTPFVLGTNCQVEIDPQSKAFDKF